MSENYDALNEKRPNNQNTPESKDLKDQIVMDSLGDIDPSSASYVEEDDELDAIAEGYR